MPWKQILMLGYNFVECVHPLTRKIYLIKAEFEFVWLIGRTSRQHVTCMLSLAGHWQDRRALSNHVCAHSVIPMWHVVCLQHLAKASSEQSRSTTVLPINHVIQIPQCLSGFVNHDYYPNQLAPKRGSERSLRLDPNLPWWAYQAISLLSRPGTLSAGGLISPLFSLSLWWHLGSAAAN